MHQLLSEDSSHCSLITEIIDKCVGTVLVYCMYCSMHIIMYQLLRSYLVVGSF